MKNYTITRNEEHNGIEIAFDSIPNSATRVALKGLGFRWHSIKKVWYGKQEHETAVLKLLGEEQTATAPTKAKAQTLWQRTRIDELPAYGTDNELKRQARATGESYDKAVAKFIRKHLRQRFPECKFSVTSGGAGWLMCCDIRILATPYKREYVKGNENTTDWLDRYDHWENSAELEAVLSYCKALHQAFDEDDGDVYADYGAHHDLYGSVEISSYYEQREPTAEELADIADFAEQLKAYNFAEEQRRQAEFLEYMKQREIEQQEAERQAAERYKKHQEICDHVTVEDLDETQQFVCLDMAQDIGKSCTISEVDKHLDDQFIKGLPQHLRDCHVTRKVNFTNSRIFYNFCNDLLNDYDFIKGTGGTMTFDERVDSWEDYLKLTKDERDEIKFFSTNCIAVCYDNVLAFVIDSQGYSYARYICKYTATVIDFDELTMTWNDYKEQEQQTKARAIA